MTLKTNNTKKDQLAGKTNRNIIIGYDKKTKKYLKPTG